MCKCTTDNCFLLFFKIMLFLLFVAFRLCSLFFSICRFYSCVPVRATWRQISTALQWTIKFLWFLLWVCTLTKNQQPFDVPVYMLIILSERCTSSLKCNDSPDFFFATFGDPSSVSLQVNNRNDRQQYSFHNALFTFYMFTKHDKKSRHTVAPSLTFWASRSSYVEY